MQDRDGQGQAHALWITAVGRCEFRPEPLKRPGEGEALVESLFGAVSRGTEKLILSGAVPLSEGRRMRGPHQTGDFPFPVKYGYAVVGRVSEGPREVQGRTVFCLHPHQDRFVVPAADLVAVPDGVPPERSVLAANMETALNIVWDAGLAPGDAVSVIGGGLVGLLVAFIASGIPAADTRLVDVDPARRPVAEALGVPFATPEEAPAERDVVIHCSASEEGLAAAIACAGVEARIVEASWYGAGETRVPLGGAFHARRLSILASQVGSVPAARRARWSTRRRLETALGLLRDDRLDALVSGETAFADLAGRYAEILAAPGTLCHRIRYS